MDCNFYFFTDENSITETAGYQINPDISNERHDASPPCDGGEQGPITRSKAAIISRNKSAQPKRRSNKGKRAATATMTIGMCC